MNQNIFLGAVADDITGASDLAINLVKGGMRVVQFLKIPTVDQLNGLDCDAVVVALKTRSIPTADAVSQSIATIEALKQSHCQRFFFKYCSTFDSTAEGNIGPVTDALLKALDCDRTILCPAFPAARRTVYQGHLFVGDRLLNDSGMQHHPLNPITDSDLVRFARQQSQHQIGLLDFQTLSNGQAAVNQRIEELVAQRKPLIVTDCCHDQDLQTIAAAVAKFTLTTGGSGIARFLPEAWREQNCFDGSAHQQTAPQVNGRSLIIAGSCSTATQRQVKHMKDQSDQVVTFEVNVQRLIDDASGLLDEVEQLAKSSSAAHPLMVYSTAPYEQVQTLQKQFGQDIISSAVERFHARVASMLVKRYGFRRLIIAGGETSGAVVAELNVDRLFIGPEICTGVPWTETRTDNNLALALKSGNFGDDAFFETALEMLGPVK